MDLLHRSAIEIPLSSDLPLWDAMNMAKVHAAEAGYLGPSALIAYQAQAWFDDQGNYHHQRIDGQRLVLKVTRV